MVIHLLVPPTFFMHLIFHIKLVPDQENSDHFVRLGNIALSQYGGCPSGGGEAPKNVFNLKNKRDSLNFFYDITGSWWFLLSTHQKNCILIFSSF
jgi:hypothetical protein